MESKRSIVKNESANVDMILTAVIAGVMFAIAIPIIYSVVGGMDYDSVDEALGWNGSALDLNRPATNASNSLLSNLATFFTIGPIYLVVVAAVGIIAAVLLLRGR
jgi:ABC-type spermidine/putrescine transport system permease subunit II